MQGQIGSGSLPVERLPSAGLAIAPAGMAKKGLGTALERLSTALRALPLPVIGRIAEDQLWLDLRCLEPAQEQGFVAQLGALTEVLR
jgi:L-seryl-tRNA(Ser) seleniumtransferase